MKIKLFFISTRSSLLEREESFDKISTPSAYVNFYKLEFWIFFNIPFFKIKSSRDEMREYLYILLDNRQKRIIFTGYFGWDGKFKEPCTRP